MAKTNLPRLRFSEFDGEYVLSSIKDITNKVKSYSLSRDYEVNDSRTEYVHYGDIHTRINNIISVSDKLPNIKDGDYTLLKSGDIVVADASEDYNEVAKPMLLENINNRNVVSGLHTIALRLDEVYPLYLYYFMQTDIYKKNCYRLANGMKVYGINYANLCKIKINLSSYIEQQKIGSFFTKIDKIIELQTQKSEQLKKLKQGYLQKMFLQDGESVPRLRFSEFGGEWKEKKIGEFAPLESGYSFKSSKFTYTGVPIVRISNILKDGSVGGDFKYYPKDDRLEKFLIGNGSILIAMSGATVGKISLLTSNDYYLNQRVGCFNTLESYDNYFVFQLLKTYKYIKNMNSIKIAGAQPNVSKKDVDKFKFNLPSYSEQKKIGLFLSKLDKLISNQDDKIYALKQQKKAYLQKMFI